MILPASSAFPRLGTPANPMHSLRRFLHALMPVAAMAAASRPVAGQPVIGLGPRDQFAWEGRRVTFSATASGTGPLSYQWQRNGVDLTAATNRTLAISEARRTDSGSYRVRVTDATGSTPSAAAKLLVRGWPQPAGPYVVELERFDTDMQSVLQTRSIPGGSLVVVKDGRLVFARGYGWADAEADEPFSPDSLCQIASLSKTITAAVVMKLVDEGRLSLTNRVFDRLLLSPAQYPGSTNDSRMTNITVRQILNHSAGWLSHLARNPSGAPGFDAVLWPELTMREMGLAAPATPTELVRWLLGRPLQAAPGTQTEYSSIGFLVAGRLIEATTGRTFEASATDLLAGAGITRTRIGRNRAADRWPGEAVCYLHPSITAADISGTDNWAEPKPLDFDLPYAYPLASIDSAAGFVASAIDHARLIASIDGLATFPDLLTTNSVNAMASGMLGWDSFASSGGASPQTGIWGKLGFMPGSIAKGVKWRNGVIYVYLLNCWEKGAVPDLDARLESSFARITWPGHDLFPATLSLEAWRAKYFSAAELSEPGTSGDLADPDGDAQPNLLEYAQGTNPRLANDPVRLTVRSAANQQHARVSVSFRRLPLEHELTYQLEGSPDLVAWSSVDSGSTESVPNPEGTISCSREIESPESSGARFYRLRVSRR